MIRPSSLDDLPAMLKMAEKFAAQYLPDLPFSKLHTARTFRAALADPNACCLTLIDGGVPMGALILQAVSYPLGPVLLAKEVIFWIEEGARGRWWRKMISEAEAWARSIGAVQMGLSCFNDGRTIKIFERAGYLAREVVASRAL